MYIGSLLKLIEKPEYRRRGTDLELAPDLVNDGNKIGWKQLTVLDIGIDISIKLKVKCFVDTVSLKFAEGSGIASSVAYTFDCDSGDMKCIGHGDDDIIIGYECDNIVIRLNADYKNIIIDSFDITGAIYDDYNIYPQPKHTLINGVGISLNDITAILADTTDDDCVFAASHLSERISELYSIAIPLKPSGKIVDKTITLSKDKNIVPEGYSINSSDAICKVNASNRLGLVYACETLLQCVSNGNLAKCIIDDSPYMEFRGAHFGLPTRSQFDFFKRLIKYVLVPMKYNTLFIEVAGSMRFDTHPEINKMWEEKHRQYEEGLCTLPPHSDISGDGVIIEKSEVADIVKYAETFGIEVIPEMQSLSHVQYITMSHPEIAEIPEHVIKAGESNLFEEDALPSEEYPSCYCAANEKSYEIIYDLMDEIINVFKPKRYVHMGHDEVYRIGVCPRCKGIDPAELYASDVNKLHDKLAEYGLKMIIWSDMLQNCTSYKTPPAIDMIPKDILMLDFIWYFHFDKDLEDRLLSGKFNVIMGNMYSSHYPRYSSRAAKPYIIGAEVSTWVAVNEYKLAYEGKMYDFLYSANMMWNSSYNEYARRAYDRVIRDIIPELRCRIKGKKPCVYKKVKTLTADRIVKVRSPHSIGASYNEIVLKIGGCYDALKFTHSADTNAERIAWAELIKVGEYDIRYSDGTSEIIPIEYGGNICDSKRRYGEPLATAYYRHEGYIGTYISDPVSLKDDSGFDMTMYRYTWENPYPNKEIESIVLKGSGNTDIEISLYAITGFNQ